MKSAVSRFLLVAFGVACFTPAAFAWDGQWTQAESGRGDVIYDANSSHSNAGTPERPQRYFIPPVRDWANVDPEEPGDYKRKDYTPYALARVTQSVRYQGHVIPKGYYVIKPGDYNDGSPNIHLQPPAAAQPVMNQPQIQPKAQQTQTLQPIFDTMDPLPNPLRLTPAVEMPVETRVEITSPDDPDFVINSNPAMAQPMNLPDVQTTVTVKTPAKPKMGKTSPGTSTASKQSQPRYSVFVIKKLGNVIAVVPIHRMERYDPPKDTKVPKQALAWLDMERQNGVERPVLRFYYKHTLYSTDFE